MKQFLTLSFLLIFTISVFAQPPENDDCDGLIDLGVAPLCPTDLFFTNVDATQSTVFSDPDENIPDCFNGGFIGNDVWFMFNSGTDYNEFSIIVEGVIDPDGNDPISNPQIAVYRGDCSLDNMAIFDCASANNGDGIVQIDLVDLDPSTPYFLRINDYSSTATPNWGSFQLCIDTLVSECFLGDCTDPNLACAGTLFDSGGPDADYSSGENETLTICPNEFHECIVLELLSYNIEQGFFGGDVLNFYAGDDISAPLLSSVSGNSLGNGFSLEVSSPCVTIEFISDGSVQMEGFELEWLCTNAGCTGSSIDNPTEINTIPFNDDESTCNDAGNFGSSPCTNDLFLNGPEWVYSFTPEETVCLSIEITNASPGTGVIVLDGPADDPATLCISQGPTGFIGSTELDAGVTYYIVVGNANGCTDFNINMAIADCLLSPALVDALCNPLNGCSETDPDGMALPSTFFFENGFQDIPNTPGVNAGCWGGVGIEPDYYWFTIEAQADGPFGFILSSADVPSDIDFNVWGPFTNEEVCETPADIIDFITNNEPIRSSYAGGTEPTGLADIHPTGGYVIEDVWDCQGNNDDIVMTIPAIEGEVYVVLANDWGNNIENGGIIVDWGPSEPDVLAPLAISVVGGDTTICEGEATIIEIETGLADIQWISNTNTLSCDNCPDPLASPDTTTIYHAVVDGVCIHDTIAVKVAVFSVDAGPDFEVCLGEDIQIIAGSNFDNAVYSWTGPNLSCDDCPDPFISTPNPGSFVYTVTLTAPTCTHTDEMTLLVNNTPAPAYETAEDTNLCIGDSYDLGVPENNPGSTYTWTSVPAGFTSNDENPTITPTEAATYYVEVSNGLCPTPSMDSVFVDISNMTTINPSSDTTVCQGEAVLLGNTEPVEGVTYVWTPINDSTANPTVFPMAGTTVYTLTASSGSCAEVQTVTVEAIEVLVDITDVDSLHICQDESVNLSATAAPAATAITWTPDLWISNTSGSNVTVTPQAEITYYANVSVPGCTVLDSVYIAVDSIPNTFPIMPSDTSVCAGATVILFSGFYEEAAYPDLDIQWTPNQGLQSPDSLWNLVLQPLESALYTRTIVNGLCTHEDNANVTIFEPTEITITPSNPSICEGESVELVASSPDITQYTWEDDSSLSCLDCPDPTASPTSTTTYTVEGEFEDCPVTESVTVEVIAAPIFDIADNASICLGTSVELNSINDTGSTYEWTSDPEGFTSTAAMPTVSPDVTTTYFVTIDNGACPPEQEEVTITVIPPYTMSVIDDFTICAGEDVELEAFLEPEVGGTFNWSPGASDTNPSTATDITETTTFMLEFTDDNGCTTLNDSVIVTVSDDFDVFAMFVPDTTTIVNTGTQLPVNATTDPAEVPGATYEWFSNDVSLGTGSMIEVIPLLDDGVTDNQDISYTVIVTNEDGCTEQATITVEVIPADSDIPNAFTPNSDNTNDIFSFVATGNIEMQRMLIFNRWGQKVFESADIDTGWDGTFNGKNMPSDVYVYIVEFKKPNGDIELLKGDVTLIR